MGVADNGGRLVQASVPAWLAGIAIDDRIGIQAGGDQHGASGCDELRPSGSNPDKFPFQCRQPWAKPRISRPNLQRDQFYPSRQGSSSDFRLAGTAHRNRACQKLWTNAIPERNTNHRAGDKGLKLGQQYLSQLWIRLDQQQMIRRGSDEPVCDAGTDGRCRQTEFPHGAEEASNVLIENLLRGGRWIHGGADVDATPVTPFRPTLAYKLPVPCTDSIRVDREAASQFASARKPVARAKIATEYGQDNLRHQLAINGNFTAGGKPESHEGPLDYSAIATLEWIGLSLQWLERVLMICEESGPWCSSQGEARLYFKTGSLNVLLVGLVGHQ